MPPLFRAVEVNGRPEGMTHNDQASAKSC